MRLLVVDDSPTIRKLVEITFRGTPWTLEFAASGAEAVAAAGRGPDAMLLDYVLPDMKAAEVCRLLAADARTRAIPVLLVSSKPSVIREELRGFTQVVGYLAKPFSGQELVAVVTAAVAAPAPQPPAAAPPAAAPSAPVPTPEPAAGPAWRRKEAAARILYARLRRNLEKLPEWARERGDAAPAAFFARKLLTPEVVDGLLDELAPLYRAPDEAPGAEPRAAEAEPSPLQKELEHLRRPSAWGDEEIRSLDLERVYERAPGFSAKVQKIELSASEQRVLTVVDGRTPLRLIGKRTGLEPREAARILQRLARIELVAPRLTLHPSSVVTSRTLALYERDRQGVQLPLEALLRRRPEPIEVRDLAGESDPVAAVRRDRPCLVLLNPEGAPFDVAEVARAIRRSEALANTSLAAVLERRSPESIDRLAAAGFDAVWVKPLHYRDVCQLIASAFLTADLVTAGERKENHVHNSHH